MPKELNPEELVKAINGGMAVQINPIVAHLPLVAFDEKSGISYTISDLQCDGRMMAIILNKKSD